MIEGEGRSSERLDLGMERVNRGLRTEWESYTARRSKDIEWDRTGKV